MSQYVPLVDLTVAMIKAARGNEIPVKNQWGDVYIVRLAGTVPGFLCRSPKTLAVVCVLTLAEVVRFCRAEAPVVPGPRK